MVCNIMHIFDHITVFDLCPSAVYWIKYHILLFHYGRGPLNIWETHFHLTCYAQIILWTNLRVYRVEVVYVKFRVLLSNDKFPASKDCISVFIEYHVRNTNVFHPWSNVHLRRLFFSAIALRLQMETLDYFSKVQYYNNMECVGTHWTQYQINSKMWKQTLYFYIFHILQYRVAGRNSTTLQWNLSKTESHNSPRTFANKDAGFRLIRKVYNPHHSDGITISDQYRFPFIHR